MSLPSCLRSLPPPPRMPWDSPASRIIPYGCSGPYRILDKATSHAARTVASCCPQRLVRRSFLRPIATFAEEPGLWRCFPFPHVLPVLHSFHARCIHSPCPTTHRRGPVGVKSLGIPHLPKRRRLGCALRPFYVLRRSPQRLVSGARRAF